jgi:molybdenum-dependent DNA-binding transcriptional regulator ModE
VVAPIVLLKISGGPFQAIARPSPREAPKIRTVDFVVMRYSDQRAHGFAVPLRYWGIDPIAHRRRDDVTAFALIVAPKCPCTSDWESVIAMPYDARLLSGVTVLMAVVEAGSMARAAEALGLTSSGVGRAIGRLETRVGVRLLERTTRTMTLTDEGRRFYEEVGPHLDGIEQAAHHSLGCSGHRARAASGQCRSFFLRAWCWPHIFPSFSIAIPKFGSN